MSVFSTSLEKVASSHDVEWFAAVFESTEWKRKPERRHFQNLSPKLLDRVISHASTQLRKVDISHRRIAGTPRSKSKMNPQAVRFLPANMPADKRNASRRTSSSDVFHRPDSATSGSSFASQVQSSRSELGDAFKEKVVGMRLGDPFRTDEVNATVPVNDANTDSNANNHGTSSFSSIPGTRTNFQVNNPANHHAHHSRSSIDGPSPRRLEYDRSDLASPRFATQGVYQQTNDAFQSQNANHSRSFTQTIANAQHNYSWDGTPSRGSRNSEDSGASKRGSHRPNLGSALGHDPSSHVIFDRHDSVQGNSMSNLHGPQEVCGIVQCNTKAVTELFALYRLHLTLWLRILSLLEIRDYTQVMRIPVAV